MDEIEVELLKEMIQEQIRNSSNVFLIGHDGPDFDSIGSCIGLYELASAFGKKAYIIVNDDSYKIESGVKRIIDENRDKYRFITRDEIPALLTDNSALILADTNKMNLISVKDNLDWFKRIMIIDHHGEDDKTVQTPIKYINEGMSSVSEMIARVLEASQVNMSKEAAIAMLAGIVLDTRNYTIKTTGETHETAKRLMAHGADIDYVNTLFLDAFETFCRINELIINGTQFRKYWDNSYSSVQVAFVLNRKAPKTVYLKEDFAKAAERMMGFAGIDAAFAMGYVDGENIHISGRSGKRINVETIMTAMGGGGSPQRAGTRLQGDVIEVEHDLMKKISLGLDSDTMLQGPSQYIKTRK